MIISSPPANKSAPAVQALPFKHFRTVLQELRAGADFVPRFAPLTSAAGSREQPIAHRVQVINACPGRCCLTMTDDSLLPAPTFPVLSCIDFATLDKDYCVPHPVSGELSYGYVAAYQSRNLSVIGGEVFLRIGKHLGFGKGFGVNHIWEGHSHELPAWGCKSIDEVPAFVAAILTQGAQVLCEGYQTRDGYRVTIVRGARGCAILSPQLDKEGGNFYSVVTAYKSHRNRGAMSVGTLKAKKAP